LAGLVNLIELLCTAVFPALYTQILTLHQMPAWEYYSLVEKIPEISELDLNPIFAQPPGQGCRIVDARIRVENLKGVGDV
jgi:hypothetical protein